MELLQTRSVVKIYNKRIVVNEVNLNVHRGEIVGLLGPNGAGKTTTFYMIVGLIKPDGGEIYFDGKHITAFPMHKRAREGIGYLSQEPSVFRRLTVEQNIMAILETMPLAKKERKRRLEFLLEDLRISRLAKNMAYTLSGGERRRLEITRALAREPSFILLDEPFSGIDPIVVAECQEIIAELKHKGLGILLTDHNVRETLAITDRAYIIHDGKVLVSGNSRELIDNPTARKIYLGENFTL